jgi:putative Holliday junction resolvase
MPIKFEKPGNPEIRMFDMENRMRWLGLDFGERRIGVAVSDPLAITAQGVAVIERAGLKKDLELIQQIIHTYEVDGIVLGLPKNMNGTEGPAAEKVRDFGRRLEERSALKVVYWDERLSTNSAQRVMIDADLSRRKRKANIDRLAAIIILQNYLDFILNSAGNCKTPSE